MAVKRWDNIRNYIGKFPTASPSQIALALKLSDMQPIYQVQHQLRKKQSNGAAPKMLRKWSKATRKKITETEASLSKLKDPEPAIFRMSVNLPESGMELKISNRKNVIGTMEFTHTGIKFRKAMGKKKPERFLSYKTLEKLMDIGIP